MFHFHKWHPWKVEKTDEICKSRYENGEVKVRVIGYQYLQSRQCSDCGLTQYKAKRIGV